MAAGKHSQGAHAARRNNRGEQADERNEREEAPQSETIYETERLGARHAAPEKTPETEYADYAEPRSRRARREEAEYDYGGDADGAGGKTGLLYVLLGAAGVLALVALIFAALTLAGVGSSGKSAATAAATSPAASADAAAQPSAAETTAASAASADALATTAPTGSVALLQDGILVPGERGAVVPERDTQLALDAFAGTTMIGNSFVEGMQLWSDIDTCDYVCADGVSLDNMIGNYLYYATVRSYSSIYLTLGLNEIGWPVDSFISKYEAVIDYIRTAPEQETTRKATIYVTSVMPVEKIMETVPAESGSTISLATIQEFNERLKQMCQEKGCWYLDVYSALADSEGYLPDDIAADDHVHFEKTGYRIWTDYLRNHYVDETLVEGNA